MRASGLQILFFFCTNNVILGDRPRMIFTDKDASFEKLRFSEHHAPVKILEGEPGAITAVGQTQISLLNFQSPQKVDLSVEWQDCAEETKACDYNITMVHKMNETNQLFVCGTNGKESTCCNMNISEHSVECFPSEKIKTIKSRMKDFILKESEPSALVERPNSIDLYLTSSGSQGYIGIRRLGTHSLRPAHHDKEQYYVDVMVSKQTSIKNVVQDKIYAFYNEKNKDTDMYRDMWLSFVTQVCTTDMGGPKNNLQFTWTSQMNARLICGDVDKRQDFSELVDVATVQAEQWQDTRVYGLFKNEWGMSAVCVYTIQEIDHIFKTSAFKSSNNKPDRPRTCVADSTKLSFETLKQIEAYSEMKEWVQPLNSSGPLLTSHHQYTHITVHNFLDKRNLNHAILFLSLNNGRIHKVMHGLTDTFIIAEYRPFNNKTHIVSMDLNPSTRMLYVTSKTHVVQLDVADCQKFGNTCEECVLARDPYCGWSEGRCTKDGALQDIEHGLHATCPTSAKVYQAPDADEVYDSDNAMEQISVPLWSRYFFRCPVSSHHAQYTWYHNSSPVPSSLEEQQSLLLVSRVEPDDEGTYSCVSDERGFSRVLARYELKLENSSGGFTPGALLWICILAALFAQK